MEKRDTIKGKRGYVLGRSGIRSREKEDTQGRRGIQSREKEDTF